MPALQKFFDVPLKKRIIIAIMRKIEWIFFGDEKECQDFVEIKALNND